MSVSRCQAEVDSREFAEWVAFNSADPFSVNRTEKMLSIVAAVIANQGRKKGDKALQPEDFVPKYGAPKYSTDEDLYVKFRAMFN